MVPRLPRLALVAATLLPVAFAGACGPAPAVTARPVEGVAAWAAGPAAAVPLTEVAAAVHEGRIWLAGGLDADGRAVATVQVLDPASGRWAEDLPLPEPLHHAALVSDGTMLFVIGGYRADGSPSARVYVRGGEMWGEHPALPEARAAGAAAWDGAGRIVYAGGVGPDGVASEIWAQGDHGWAPYGRLPAPLEHLAATSDGAGSVFVLGGRRGGLDTNVARVEVVTPDGARHAGDLPTARGGVAAFWWPSLGACLVGGESPAGTHPEVECIDRRGAVVALPPLGRPRHGLGAVVAGDRAWVLLGGERPGLFVSDAVETLTLP